MDVPNTDKRKTEPMTQEPRPPTIVSIQVGKPETTNCHSFRSDTGETTWTTGFGKQPVAGSVRLRKLNFDGDAQADLKHHGGPDKAVCVYPASHYAFWQSELSIELVGGAFGENLTVAELTEDDVCIGDVWRIGDARVQVSQPRQPCWKLSRWWNIKDLALRVQQTGRTGWYLRVLEEGDVEPETPITLVDRVHQDWSIAAANELMHHDKKNIAKASSLANLAELSASWRDTLNRRCQNQPESTPERRLFGEIR